MTGLLPSCGVGGHFDDVNSVEFLFSPELYLSVGGRPARTFRHLTTSRQVGLVSDIAALLGSSAHLYTIADHLLEGIRELGRQDLSITQMSGGWGLLYNTSEACTIVHIGLLVPTPLPHCKSGPRATPSPVKLQRRDGFG